MTGLAITTDLTAPADTLTNGAQTVVLRVAQEALQNVRKHAAASIVVVDDQPGAGRRGSWRSATTVAGSTPERWRRGAVATSDFSSCASEPS